MQILTFSNQLENYQKAASLDHGSRLIEVLTTIGCQYFQAGFPKKGNDFFLEALKLDDDSINYSDNLIRSTAGLEPDYKKAIEYFEKRHLKDSTNRDIFLDLGYFYTYLGNYKQSLKYYNKYLSTLKAGQPGDVNMENYVGYSYLQNGYRKEAEYYFNRQIDAYKDVNSAPPDKKLIWAYHLAAIYACKGDKAKAYENLKIFNQFPSFALIWVTQLKTDPRFSSIRIEPEFQKILRDVEAKYQTLHEKVGEWMKEQGK